MTTWIFLRGLTRDSRHWGDFVETFRRTVPDSRIVTLDFPGNGPLHRLTSPCSVDEMVDYCRHALSSRGLAPPYNILAMSLGAMVAVAWAHTHPRELACGVLINTSLRSFSPFYHRLRPRNFLRLLKLALLGARPNQWEESIFRMTSQLRTDSAEVLDHWISFRAAHPVTRQNAWRQLCAAIRFRAPDQKPLPALLILVSRNDQLVHPDCSYALASAWQCEIRAHPRAGHDLPLDDGQWVAAQVQDWLGSSGLR